MTTTPIPRPIADLDVPRADVKAELKKTLPWAQPTAERLDWLAEHPTPASAGELAEYSHLLHHADPDDTTRSFVDLKKGRKL